jgi:hypothetical protein
MRRGVLTVLDMQKELACHFFWQTSKVDQSMYLYLRFSRKYLNCMYDSSIPSRTAYIAATLVATDAFPGGPRCNSKVVRGKNASSDPLGESCRGNGDARRQGALKVL